MDWPQFFITNAYVDKRGEVLFGDKKFDVALGFKMNER